MPDFIIIKSSSRIPHVKQAIKPIFLRQIHIQTTTCDSSSLYFITLKLWWMDPRQILHSFIPSPTYLWSYGSFILDQCNVYGSMQWGSDFISPWSWLALVSDLWYLVYGLQPTVWPGSTGVMTSQLQWWHWWILMGARKKQKSGPTGSWKQRFGKEIGLPGRVGTCITVTITVTTSSTHIPRTTLRHILGQAPPSSLPFTHFTTQMTWWSV